jgi:hypothetical protein
MMIITQHDRMDVSDLIFRLLIKKQITFDEWWILHDAVRRVQPGMVVNPLPIWFVHQQPKVIDVIPTAAELRRKDSTTNKLLLGFNDPPEAIEG